MPADTLVYIHPEVRRYQRRSRVASYVGLLVSLSLLGLMFVLAVHA
ncbi:hypothetical protein [Curvivirga sp.]